MWVKMYLMNEEKAKKIGMEPYKGVRDFYPQDMVIQNHIFNIWREIALKYGYKEYNASVLEPAELYIAKSGEEIVNEQTYTFKDRGDRDVTIRPEMTPTVARMIAVKKRELPLPIRWFSIPNLFRYEQPQRGRLREHWQLNVDIFGVDSINAEIEIIQIANEIVKAYGLKENSFEIRLNSRKTMNYIFNDVFGLGKELSYKISKLIDKKNKIGDDKFKSSIEEMWNTDSGKTSQEFITLLNSKNFEQFASNLPKTENESQGIAEIKKIIESLNNLGINNVRFDQTLMRGFDYYTGTVFEIFDLNPANKRAVMGGGRYDDLLSIFDQEKVPAFGFGAGDVIAKDLMETYGTLPKDSDSIDITICPIDSEKQEYNPYVNELAQSLRQKGLKISIDFTDKKIGDKLKNAERQGAKYAIAIGQDEVKTGKLKLKNLSNRDELVLDEDSIVKLIKG